MDTPLLESLPESNWNAAAARHLLNRAGFGVPEERVASLFRQGLTGAVNEVVGYARNPSPEPAPAFVIAPISAEERRESLAGLSEEDRRKKTSQWRQEERKAIQQLKAWWLERMATTPCPLEEKMALFWHGHFATSAQKVQSSYHTYQLNDVFRMNATGNVKSLCIAVGQSPSMLRYLDNGRSTKKNPNENWARELMELFTMGVGAYSEDDIKNSARAFTGWSADHMQFQYREQVHDFGPKRFQGREGDFDGWDIIDIIFDQPVTATFICGKLWTYFAYEDPEPEIVEGLAATLREHRYELKPVLRRMLASKAFYSARAQGSQIKSPVHYVIQLAHDLKLDSPPYPSLARATAQLGQDLFYPPNVKGWDGNRAWINANSLLIRYNLPVAVAANEGGASPAMDDPAMMMLMDGRQDDMRNRVQEALAKLPQSQRRAMRQRFQNASPDERRQLGQELLAAQPSGGTGWSTRGMIAGLPTATGAQFVQSLTTRFLSVPMSVEQHALLMTTMGLVPDAPVDTAALTDTQLNAGLHLLFSSAEYQLC